MQQGPRRIALLLAGFTLVGSGVAAMITAELGVAPYDVVLTGLVEVTGLPIGLVAMIVPIVFTGIGFALGGRVGPATLLAVLCVGPILQVVLDLMPELDAMAARIAFMLGGFLMIACGITAVLLADLGPGPAEVLMLAIHGRGLGLALTRTIIEVTSVAVGWAMGGQVGVGTVVVALGLGPVLRQLLDWAGWSLAHPERPTDDAVVCVEPGA
jgi:uncharacterized membrane protein YczE